MDVLGAADVSRGKRGDAVREEGAKPQLNAVVSIVGVDRIVLGGDENHIVRALARNRQVRNVEGLGVHVTIGGQSE